MDVDEEEEAVALFIRSTSLGIRPRAVKKMPDPSGAATKKRRKRDTTTSIVAIGKQSTVAIRKTKKNMKAKLSLREAIKAREGEMLESFKKEKRKRLVRVQVANLVEHILDLTANTKRVKKTQPVSVGCILAGRKAASGRIQGPTLALVVTEISQSDAEAASAIVGHNAASKKANVTCSKVTWTKLSSVDKSATTSERDSKPKKEVTTFKINQNETAKADASLADKKPKVATTKNTKAHLLKEKPKVTGVKKVKPAVDEKKPKRLSAKETRVTPQDTSDVKPPTEEREGRSTSAPCLASTIAALATRLGKTRKAREAADNNLLVKSEMKCETSPSPGAADKNAGKKNQQVKGTEDKWEAIKTEDPMYTDLDMAQSMQAIGQHGHLDGFPNVSWSFESQQQQLQQQTHQVQKQEQLPEQQQQTHPEQQQQIRPDQQQQQQQQQQRHHHHYHQSGGYDNHWYNYDFSQWWAPQQPDYHYYNQWWHCKYHHQQVPQQPPPLQQQLHQQRQQLQQPQQPQRPQQPQLLQQLQQPQQPQNLQQLRQPQQPQQLQQPQQHYLQHEPKQQQIIPELPPNSPSR